MRMVLAEDLLLLLLDNETGKKSGENREIALGGALLTELALDGAVEVVESRRLFSGARVRVVPGADPDDEVLARALATVGEKERTAQDPVTRLSKRLEPTLLDRLAAAGILERREHDVLGIFPTTAGPASTTPRSATYAVGSATPCSAAPLPATGMPPCSDSCPPSGRRARSSTARAAHARSARSGTPAPRRSPTETGPPRGCVGR